jgi:hypothetical protein
MNPYDRREKLKDMDPVRLLETFENEAGHEGADVEEVDALGNEIQRRLNLLADLETQGPAATEEPPPRPGRGDMWKLVVQDMEERRKMGLQKYGTPLQADNGRDPLVDAYQEALDLCVYLRQAIEERDAERRERVGL